MLWTNSAGKQYYTDDTPRKESTKRDQPDSLRLYNQLKPRLFDAIKEYVGTDRDRAHEVMTHLRTQYPHLRQGLRIPRSRYGGRGSRFAGTRGGPGGGGRVRMCFREKQACPCHRLHLPQARLQSALPFARPKVRARGRCCPGELAEVRSGPQVRLWSPLCTAAMHAQSHSAAPRHPHPSRAVMKANRAGVQLPFEQPAAIPLLLVAQLSIPAAKNAASHTQRLPLYMQ
jgi:hypothetical protein